MRWRQVGGAKSESTYKWSPTTQGTKSRTTATTRKSARDGKTDGKSSVHKWSQTAISSKATRTRSTYAGAARATASVITTEQEDQNWEEVSDATDNREPQVERRRSRDPGRLLAKMRRAAGLAILNRKEGYMQPDWKCPLCPYNVRATDNTRTSFKNLSRKRRWHLCNYHPEQAEALKIRNGYDFATTNKEDHDENDLAWTCPFCCTSVLRQEVGPDDRAILEGWKMRHKNEEHPQIQRSQWVAANRSAAARKAWTTDRRQQRARDATNAGILRKVLRAEGSNHNIGWFKWPKRKVNELRIIAACRTCKRSAKRLSDLESKPCERGRPVDHRGIVKAQKVLSDHMDAYNRGDLAYKGQEDLSEIFGQAEVRLAEAEGTATGGCHDDGPGETGP